MAARTLQRPHRRYVPIFRMHRLNVGRLSHKKRMLPWPPRGSKSGRSWKAQLD